nr:MAG TPA: hypothetical protein [Caudoviricetes sp.]
MPYQISFPIHHRGLEFIEANGKIFTCIYKKDNSVGMN